MPTRSSQTAGKLLERTIAKSDPGGQRPTVSTAEASRTNTRGKGSSTQEG